MSLIPSIEDLRRAHAERVAAEEAERARVAAETARKNARIAEWNRWMEEALSNPEKRRRLEENAIKAGVATVRMKSNTPEFRAAWRIMRLDWAVDMVKAGLPYNLDWAWKE